MSPSSALHWRSVPTDAIAWHKWDGEFVVRNERTGSTHLLGPLAGRVLQALLEADGTRSAAELEAGLGDQPAAASDGNVAIDAVLSEFQRLGLAEPERR